MNSRALYTMFILIGCSSIKDFVRADTNHEVLSVTLYTDLVDVIVANITCNEDASSANTTTYTAGQLSLKQGVVLSKYQFHKTSLVESVIGACEKIEIKMEVLTPYDWTCFSTGSNESRDTNWFMVDCAESESLTINCFEGTEFIDVIKSICNTPPNITDTTGCKEITYGRTNKYAICSKYFHTEKKTRRINLAVTGRSLMDIIAYMCAAFILITFIITILIPVEKCKPSYKYDKEQSLRVPLKIYEMYGVDYKPSARKKITRKSFNPHSVPTVSVEVNNKSKDDPLDDTRNGSMDHGNANKDTNKKLEKVLRHIKEHTNNGADAAKDTVDDNTEKTDTKDTFIEEDSGDYDTIVFPHIEHETTTNSKADQEDITSGDTSSDGVSLTEFKEILQATVTSNNRRHTTALNRFSQCQCKFDKVDEEDESTDSGVNENHDERRRRSNEYINNCERRYSTEINNGRHSSKERNAHLSFDGRELIDESKKKSTRMKSFDGASSTDSSLNNSETNIVYDYEIDDNKINHRTSQRNKFKTSRKSSDRLSKSRTKSRDDYNQHDNEHETSSGSSGNYYESLRIKDVKSNNERVSQKAEADVTNMQDSSQRPRISITVEFPQNFGQPSIGENKQLEPEQKTRTPSGGLKSHNQKSYNSCKRDYKRSRSVADTPKDNGKSARERKFSLC